MIIVVGIDHHTAPVEVREQLALTTAQLPVVLARLIEGPDAPLREAVVLATCNRVEVYGAADAEDDHTLHALVEQVIGVLHAYHGLSSDAYASLFYHYHGAAAVAHLFAATAGLRSMVVGEAQIQGQVRAAQQAASEAGASGPVLQALFRHALETGKRIRTETGIDRNAVSVSQAGVALARQRLGSLAAARVLLVGSGKMSELAAKNLLDNGARSITLVNRSSERARQLAAVWGGVVRAFEDLPAALCEADVVISSTAAPHPVIQAAHVQAAVVGRQTPLVLIDLAVPRDIAADVVDIAGAEVYNIDDLEQVVVTNVARRQGEIAAAQAIIAGEVVRFEGWLQARAVLPALTGLRAHAEAIRRDELAKALHRLGPLDDRERQIVEALSQSIVNKLLHQPTVRLKDEAARGNGGHYAQALQTLFGLGE